MLGLGLDGKRGLFPVERKFKEGLLRVNLFLVLWPERANCCTPALARDNGKVSTQDFSPFAHRDEA